jgi:hypothetical protein
LRAISSRYQRPAQDRVGRDQARELAEPATADDPALDGQASPLVVGEAQPPSAELLVDSWSTRFSSRRKSTTSSWRELTQPAIQTTRNRTASVPIAPPW